MAFLAPFGRKIVTGALAAVFGATATIFVVSKDDPKTRVEQIFKDQYGVSSDGKRTCLLISDGEPQSHLLCRERGFTHAGMYLMDRFARDKNHSIRNASPHAEYSPE